MGAGNYQGRIDVAMDCDHASVLGLSSSMNRIQKNKLVLSKWTAVEPKRGEKHFIVTRVERRPDGDQIVVLEAIHSKMEYAFPWRTLKDDTRWCHGWR